MLNWAGSIQYAADIVDEPTSVDEVQRLVKRGTPLKALGTRPIAESTRSSSRAARRPGRGGSSSARRLRAPDGAAPVDEARAIRFRMLRVHGTGGNGAHLPRPVRDPILASDEGEGAVHDEQARVEVVSVRLPAHMRLDLALADLVAFPQTSSLELDPGHGILLVVPSAGRRSPTTVRSVAASPRGAARNDRVRPSTP
jgi:hypothetical protein